MEEILALLPPEWVAPVTEWVIVALTVALAATAAVHTVLPLARRFEAWARTTKNALDDGIASGLLTGLLAISRAGSWVITHVPRLAVGDPRPPAGNISPPESSAVRRQGAGIAGNRGALGADGPENIPPSAPPSGGALALALVIAAAALSAATGCGAGAIGMQADMIAGAGIVWAEADTALVQLRSADLDSIVEAAREECGQPGCSAERSAHYRAELAAAERRWAPAMECRATVPAALRSWMDGLETARAAQTGDVGLELLARLGGRFALDYVAFTRCVNARAPVDDPHLPPLDPALQALAEQLTGTTTARTAGGEDGSR